MSDFIYSFHVAVKNLWREKWINILTMLTIAVGLLILGAFILVTVNMDAAIKRWSKDFGIIVYLKENLSPEEEKLLGEYFKDDPDVVEIKYISKERALDEFRQTLGSMTSILEGFEENPLPSSFELKLKREALSPVKILQKTSQIRQLSGVEDVQYGEKWLSSLHTMTEGMKIVGLLLGTIIFIAISFVTYSTIKILFYRRLDEIETLKLLGATRRFIRYPFLLEGFFIGTLGGLLGFISLIALYSFVSVKMTDFLPSFSGVLTFFPLELYPVIPVAGAVLSLIGSFFAVGKIKY